jgi:type IV pilus assembly protein PilV
MHSRRAARGVSLIEVLMAVLVFSLGLIGLAGLLVVSTKSNQQAFVRTQVTFLASSMADRMRANPYGLWAGSYNVTFPVTGDMPACDATAACGPADVALRDQLIWYSQLQAFLPGLGPTSISCSTSGAGYDPTSVIGMRPPYGGVCTMKVAWGERGYGATDDKTDSSQLQSFTWVFEP